jgi:D-alanine-D-alanine ligase
MDKAKVKVGVLMGGLSAERPISLKTGAGVLGALRERGWNAVEIVVGRDLPQQLLANHIDVAWIALHGKFGEDGCVQGLLEVMGIPYTGSAVRASAVAMDKVSTKRAMIGVPGVVMARDTVVHGPGPIGLTFPVVVKPANAGSTIGISIVKSPAELDAAVTAARVYDSEILVEEFVEGDEITVAVVDGKAYPVVRILPESGFFDYAAKYTKGMTKYECPAQILPKSFEAAQRAAEAAYVALGCRGLARADFIVRKADGQPVFLEINTIPGMTPTSLSPMAAKVVGISYPELCEKILVTAACMTEEKPAA